MQSFIRSITTALAATSALALVLGAMPALADDPDGVDGAADPGVARLSVLRGEVDVKRADSGDTVAAAVNAPVAAGDYVTTHENSRVEVQYGYGTAVRVAPDTQLRFTHLDPDNHALQLAQGTVALRVFRGLEAHPEIETPSATIRPDEQGAYRVTVTNDGNTEVTVRSGHADVITASGTQTLAPDSSLLVEGQGNDLHFQTIQTVAMDAFDEWNAQRDGTFSRVHDYGYVDQGIVGADDLDEYGHWVDEPTYGRVWTPYETAGWAPYHDGRWVWEDYYGWTWVGDEPWGYAPYHYGNWFYANNSWFWYPGAYAAVRVYRPALVGFFSFGFGGGGFSIGFGNIGWVPLAPFEPFRPWWGRGYANRTVVNITNIRNVTNINIYHNLRAPNASAAVSNANFANGNFERRISVSAADLKTVAPVRGVLPIVPTTHNLVLNPRANAPISTAAAPLSSRFAGFRTANVARPASFNTQRETVAATAAKLYPEHAAAIAHPETLNRATTNGATANERSASAPERNETTSRTNGNDSAMTGNRTSEAANRAAETTNRASAPETERSTPSRDPWSRFGGSNTSGAEPTHASASRETPSYATPETSRNAAASRNASTSNEGTTRPAVSGSTGGGSAWRRFNNSGSATSGSATRSSTTGTTTGRRYGNYGAPATTSGGYPRTSTSRSSDYGSSSARSSAPSYHQPASTYRATPSYHAAPAASHPAPSSGGAAHAPAPSKGGGDKPAGHESDHGR